MQVHATHKPASGELYVRLNPSTGDPFAVISLGEYGQLEIFVESVADADRLIRAAVAAKELLIQATGAQVRVAVEDEGGQL